MTRSARMLLMNANKRNGYRSRNNDDYSDYRRFGYEAPEDKFRDRRGREHYDNGRYAPMNDGGIWVESRQGRDSIGRYTGARSHYNDGEYYHDGDEYMNENYYPYTTPYVPPVYNNYSMNRDVERKGYNKGMDSRYNDRSERATNRSRVNTNQPRNKIGFSIDGEMERLEDHIGTGYRTSADYNMQDEMAYRQGSKSSGYGHSSSDGNYELTDEMASQWLEHMENVDGTTGPHWNIEQTKRVMAQKGLQLDPVLFYLTMNMMYSDYNKVAKKLGVNNTDFYACMAEAFLTDPDSLPPAEKLGNYYKYIVKN